MPIVRNEAKRKLSEGGLALGFGVHHLRSIATPLLAVAGEHDFLFIDMEHGAFTVQEASQICIAALGTGMAPIARVCAGAIDEGTRLLDNGAMGIVMPHVDTPAQAKLIADAFHYPAAGTRSWGGPAALYGYQTPNVAIAQAEINNEILTTVMIESQEGVRNADAIAAILDRRSAHRQFRPDHGTRDRWADGASEAHRRVSGCRRGLSEARQGAWHGRDQRRRGRAAFYRHGLAIHHHRFGSQLYRGRIVGEGQFPAESGEHRLTRVAVQIVEDGVSPSSTTSISSRTVWC
jgi:hypothetical protein